MIVSIIYIIISFILENIMSNIFVTTLNNVSTFTTIYTIIALVVIYPYFASDKKYFLLVIISGFLFDTIYTSTILLNLTIFLVISLLIKTLNNIISDNIIMTNIISLISVATYHILTFIILNIVTSKSYSIILLGKILTHSIIMTIIYTSISYIIIKYLYSRLSIKQIK